MTGTGLEHRLATSVKSISFLPHCAKMAAAAPGITTVSRQKRRSWHMSPRLIPFSRKSKHYPQVPLQPPA